MMLGSGNVDPVKACSCDGPSSVWVRCGVACVEISCKFGVACVDISISFATLEPLELLEYVDDRLKTGGFVAVFTGTAVDGGGLSFARNGSSTLSENKQKSTITRILSPERN